MAGNKPKPPTLEEQRNALLEHIDLCIRLHGEKPASRMMRKFGIRFATHHPTPEEVKSKFIQVESMQGWKAVVEEYYSPKSNC